MLRGASGCVLPHQKCRPNTCTTEENFSWGLNIIQEHRRKGYASEALPIVKRYSFQELRNQKVKVHNTSFNEASIKLHERLGFQQEGRISRTNYTDGQYFDDLVYGLTKEEFAAKHGNMPIQA
jgi:RimJ/RimL family protein N-acetyltransferase